MSDQLVASDLNGPATAGRTPRRAFLGSKLLHHFLLVLIGAAFLLPLAVMVRTALSIPDAGGDPGAGPRWGLENFRLAIEGMPFARYLLNTGVIVVGNVVGTLLSCPLAAYGLAKFQFRGQRIVFGMVLATLMLPAQVTFLPLYLMWSKVGAVGTYWPLLLPAFFGTPFYIFLLRQFIASTPDSLLEAARIDGASELVIYFRIVLPQLGSALATVAVFQFVATWTDFLLPLIYLTNESDYTLSVGLYNFFGQHSVAWGPLMAACLMFTVPALILFVFVQRYFVQGISVSGIK